MGGKTNLNVNEIKKVVVKKNGTTVSFQTRYNIFCNHQILVRSVIRNDLRESAFLLKNLRIELIDEKKQSI